MSKTALFNAAAGWDEASIRRVLAAKPALVRQRDARGRLAIHLCARRSWPAHRDESAHGMASLPALIDAGTAFDAVHPIPEAGEIFPARRSGMPSRMGRIR